MDNPPNLSTSLRSCTLFVVSPSAFFSEWRLRKPNWPLAVSSPLICAILQFSASLCIANKTRPLLERISRQAWLTPRHLNLIIAITAGNAASSFLIIFGLSVVGLVSIQVLFKDFGNAKRLAEAAGICYFSQIPSCLVLVWCSLRWKLPSGTFPAVSGNDFITMTQSVRQLVAQSSTFAPIHFVSAISMLWLFVLMTCVLRYVGELPLRSIALATAILASAIAGAHWIAIR
jgi:hypothetical protein